VWDVPACRAVSGHVDLRELWGCSMSLHAAEVNARIARQARIQQPKTTPMLKACEASLLLNAFWHRRVW